MGSGASWPLSTVDLIIDDSIDGVVYGVRGFMEYGLIIDDSIDGVVYGVRGFMASQHRGPVPGAIWGFSCSGLFVDHDDILG